MLFIFKLQIISHVEKKEPEFDYSSSYGNFIEKKVDPQTPVELTTHSDKTKDKTITTNATTVDKLNVKPQNDSRASGLSAQKNGASESDLTTKLKNILMKDARFNPRMHFISQRSISQPHINAQRVKDIINSRNNRTSEEDVSKKLSGQSSSSQVLPYVLSEVPSAATNSISTYVTLRKSNIPTTQVCSTISYCI